MPTSGCVSHSFSPSGEQQAYQSNFFHLRLFIKSIAKVEEPPVASIGSTMKISLLLYLRAICSNIQQAVALLRLVNSYVSYLALGISFVYLNHSKSYCRRGITANFLPAQSCMCLANGVSTSIFSTGRCLLSRTPSIRQFLLLFEFLDTSLSVSYNPQFVLYQG